MKKVYSILVCILILSLLMTSCSLFEKKEIINKVPGISYKIPKDMTVEQLENNKEVYFHAFKNGNYISISTILDEPGVKQLDKKKNRDLLFTIIFNSLKRGYSECKEIESKEIKILGNPAKQIDYSQKRNGEESCGRMIIFYYGTAIYMFNYTDLDANISKDNLNIFMKIIRSVKKR